ncbi:MAG: hypothetical protein HYX80_09125 [Chloroflexi bacterium]|nr:hypothetical protein [Chloroflexota bacterium]
MALEAGTKEAEIKAAIEKIVGGRRINVWTVGVTDNVDLRREAHGRPTIWHYWHAESEQVAKNVESHFKAQGMKGYSGASGENAHNVYITW